jgi:hypothetical protein
MNRQVSLFHRSTATPENQRNTALFAHSAKPAAFEADYGRSTESVNVAEALKAAHARMNRLFTSH